MKTYCPTCEEYVTPEWEDEGIGEYEYWGCKGNDTCMCATCPDCEEPLEASWAEYYAEQESEWADYRAQCRKDDAFDSYTV